MTKQNGKRSLTNQSSVYKIRVEGHLDDQWKDRFEGMSITLEGNGDSLDVEVVRVRQQIPFSASFPLDHAVVGRHPL